MNNELYLKIDHYRKEFDINIYAYQPNISGYWAHSLEGKAKYDSWEEAIQEGIEEADHRLNSTI